jgi:hypothetical protein
MFREEPVRAAGSEELETKPRASPAALSIFPLEVSLTSTLLKKRCRLLIEGKVKFRYEYPDYPCDLLKTLDKRYHQQYTMSLLENLAVHQRPRY